MRYLLLFFLVFTFTASAITAKHNAYTVEYDPVTHCAVYVIYELTSKDILDNHKRFSFRRDPLIPETISDSIYRNSGWERGHLCPGEDKGFETYYTSNIVPQNPTLNKGLWKELEMNIRKRVMSGENLIIITGCIFIDENENYISGTVKIPDLFFKIVIGKTTKAYLIPNQALKNENIEDYCVRLNIVESLVKFKITKELR